MSVESRIAKGEVKVNGRSVGDIDYNQKQELIVTILFRYLADLTNPNIKNGLLSYMEDKSQVKRLEKVNKSAANLAEAFNIKELSLALAELVMKNSTILHSDLKLIRWKMEHTLNDDHLTIEGLLKKFPQLVDPYELYDLFLSWNGKVDRDSSVAPIKKMQAVTAKKYLDDFLDIGFVKSKLEDFFYGALQPHYNYGNQHTSGFTIDREYLKQAMTVSYNTIIDEAKRSYNYEYATIIGFIENNPNNKNIKRLVSLKKEYVSA